MPHYLGEHIASHPVFSSSSPARLEDLPQPRDTTEIEPIKYTADDDAAIEDWVRKTVGTAYHSIGTCPMRPRERQGVVDTRLNVYGVRGLKVAGMSMLCFGISAAVCDG